MNKIPILMPMYNRPQYLEQSINSLKNCENIDKFFVITFEEPNEECSKIIDNITSIEVIRNKNQEILGCQKNFLNVFKTALSYEKFIILEDDIVPQKDFLNYFLWAFEEFYNSEYIKTISAYSRGNGEANKVELTNYFCPWGWGGWSHKLNNTIDFTFPDKNHGWDYYLDQYIIKNNLFSVKPILSRVQNIGEIGTYVPSPEWHRENQRTKYTINDLNIKPIKNYILI